MMPLDDGWTLLETPAGQLHHPDTLPDVGWQSASVPGTVAQSLATPLESAVDLEASDWWYRCTFSCPAALQLRFSGLATLAEVWLDGALVLSTQNMFRAYTVAIGIGDHMLAICFRSLSAALVVRRPRPRWRAGLVEQQRLRFFRTTLLGRIPGWTPRLPPIGPWRAIVLEAPPLVDDLSVQTDAIGTAGRLRVSGSVAGAVVRARLRVGEETCDLDLVDGRLSADLTLPDVSLWWPHTHGTPHLYDCTLLLTTAEGEREQSCGRVGFRSVTVDRGEGRVSLRVNGRP
ncbi:MAG: beta-mannosidase, partial [Myxococcota bacterium]